MPVVVGASARGVAADGGASFFRPKRGLAKREPAPDPPACALACPSDPALSFLLQCGATKVRPALLSSLPCDQLSRGTTELRGCFNGPLSVAWRLNAAGSREHTGPGTAFLFPSVGLLASSSRPAWSSTLLGWSGSTNAARAGEQRNEPDEPRGYRLKERRAKWRARAG